MSIQRSGEYLLNLIKELRDLPTETEWVEFKVNNCKPQLIGEYISALSNSAALHNKNTAYMLWGIEDKTHDIVGTEFNPETSSIGAEHLKNWLHRLISPNIHFDFHKIIHTNGPVVLLEIQPAFSYPVRFEGKEYIRNGSHKKPLSKHPEKEAALWRVFDSAPFEKEIAVENITSDEVIKLLNYPEYFTLLNLPLPETRSAILDTLKSDEMILKSSSGNWSISNLGAILFARKLSDFKKLKRKVVRVIKYKGNSKLDTIREEIIDKGYAVGFQELIKSIMQLLPSNEIIGKVYRQEIAMFPELAIRELIANALIHQNFHSKGTHLTVELFDNRVEITNPGLPLIQTDRFLDLPPKSRNESVASFMRRAGLCEERGSGIDKVVIQTELYQLPAPIFSTADEHTQSTLFAHKELREMDKLDRLRACYLHAVLKYVQKDPMTNSSLRERFGIEIKNSSIASRIIGDTIEAGLIRCQDEKVGTKSRKYIPSWA